MELSAWKRIVSLTNPESKPNLKHTKARVRLTYADGQLAKEAVAAFEDRDKAVEILNKVLPINFKFTDTTNKVAFNAKGSMLNTTVELTEEPGLVVSSEAEIKNFLDTVQTIYTFKEYFEDITAKK